MTSPSGGAAAEILYVGNDMILELRGLQRQDTAAYMNAATVTVTMKDSEGTTIAGSWPQAMGYVSSSNGVYRATLAYNMAVTENARYTATVTADGGAGLRARWDIPCFVRTRT